LFDENHLKIVNNDFDESKGNSATVSINALDKARVNSTSTCIAFSWIIVAELAASRANRNLC